jgi:hypothetical protein
MNREILQMCLRSICQLTRRINLNWHLEAGIRKKYWVTSRSRGIQWWTSSSGRSSLTISRLAVNRWESAISQIAPWPQILELPNCACLDGPLKCGPIPNGDKTTAVTRVESKADLNWLSLSTEKIIHFHRTIGTSAASLKVVKQFASLQSPN